MKNFKLLLATTAILSTGALLANAEFSNPELEIKAKAFFAKSITVSSSPIHFGGIDPSAGGYVTVSANGNVTGTAKIITDDYSNGYVTIEGLGGYNYSDMVIDGSDPIDIVLTGKTFNLYEEEATQDEDHRCGTVRNLERGASIYNSNFGKIIFYVGGTLDVNADYEPAVGGNHCSGSVEVTYVVNTNKS